MAVVLRILAMLGLLAAKEDRLAEDMLRRIRAAMPGQPLTLRDQDTIVAEGAKTVFHLDRLRQNCRTVSAIECERLKRAYMRAMTEARTFSADTLRVIVRDEQWVAAALDMPERSDEPPLLLRRIGDDLYAILASEGRSSIATVPRRQLAEHGLQPRTAWALARKQTDAKLPPLPTAEQLHRGLVVFESHEFGATLLTREAAWRRLSAAVGPDMIVTVVSDHVVLVGVKPDGPDLDAFKKLVAEDCEQQERCISPHAYRFRDGRWAIAR